MDTLINFLRRANGQLESGWLYLPAEGAWNLNTLGLIIDDDELDIHEVDEQDEPLIAKEKGLISTLNTGTIESIFSFAKSLDFELTDDFLFESFQYYYDYDAFLPYPGFKPLEQEEYQRKVDRDFYDCLGEERSQVQCKNEECQRGAITSSAYCRAHHFEMVQNKPYPFID
ncbi:hypothetical protein N5094_09005 [Shewanella putrefaciens]|uniref:DUF7716 domain-containing protein n=1 Tax=Shewanella putrefaciens TaxID=24 RepID=UPI0021BFE0E2|nr:hypothetical protein [Shewanella putrefaciens]UXK10299.1 hypothetical protein N5094_09005 [Shewanella putrefaciens]